jgi:hypothetical protein
MLSDSRRPLVRGALLATGAAEALVDTGREATVALRVFRLAVRGALLALRALPDTARLATLPLRGFDLECDGIFYIPVVYTCCVWAALAPTILTRPAAD